MRRLVVGAVVVMGLGAIGGAAYGALHSPGAPGGGGGVVQVAHPFHSPGAPGGGAGWYAVGTQFQWPTSPAHSCSAASSWCVTATHLSSGLAIWEVSCGLLTESGHADSACPAINVSVVGPIAPPDVIGVGLPGIPAGSRALPVDAGGAVNCVGYRWCIAGGEALVAAPSAPVGVTSNYVAPEIYCETSCGRSRIVQ